MNITRRAMFSGLFLPATASVLAAAPASAALTPLDVQKVVYHVSDYDKAAFALGNIANHIEGKGGPNNVHIVLVVHGRALGYFRKTRANPEMVRKLAKISADGVGLAACGNTMRGDKIALDDLLPGFEVAEEGGVVRIADLQAQGYLYIRP